MLDQDYLARRQNLSEQEILDQFDQSFVRRQDDATRQPETPAKTPAQGPSLFGQVVDWVTGKAQDVGNAIGQGIDKAAPALKSGVDKLKSSLPKLEAPEGFDPAAGLAGGDVGQMTEAGKGAIQVGENVANAPLANILNIAYQAGRGALMGATLNQADLDKPLSDPGRRQHFLGQYIKEIGGPGLDVVAPGENFTEQLRKAGTDPTLSAGAFYSGYLLGSFGSWAKLAALNFAGIKPLGDAAAGLAVKNQAAARVLAGFATRIGAYAATGAEIGAITAPEGEKTRQAKIGAAMSVAADLIFLPMLKQVRNTTSASVQWDLINRKSVVFAKKLYRDGVVSSMDEALATSYQVAGEKLKQDGFQAFTPKNLVKGFKELRQQEAEVAGIGGAQDVTNATVKPRYKTPFETGQIEPPPQPGGGTGPGPVRVSPLSPAQADAIATVRSPRSVLPFGFQSPRQIDKTFDTHNFAILTATNPQRPVQIDLQGRDPNEVLIQDLLSRGYTPEDIIPVQGKEEGRLIESFGVVGMDPNETKEILDRYGQGFAMVKGGMLEAETGNLTPSTGRTWGKDAEAQEFNTTIGKHTFSEYLDFGNVQPHPELQQPTPEISMTKEAQSEFPPETSMTTPEIDSQIQELQTAISNAEQQLQQLPPEVVSQITDLVAQRSKSIAEETEKPSIFDQIRSAAEDALSRLKNESGELTIRENIPAIQDMTKVGVSLLAQGTPPDKFREAFAQRLGDQLIPENMIARVQRASEKQWQNLLKKTQGNFPSMEQLLEMFRAGMPGMKWYNKAWQEIQGFTRGFSNYVEGDDRRFARLTAALSMRMNPRRNIQMAIDVWYNYKSGNKEGFEKALGKHPFGAAIVNARRALNDEPFGEDARKITNFAENLMGNLDVSTIDVGMGSAFGLPTAHITETEFRNLDQITRDAAAIQGVKAAEMQAAIWQSDRILNAAEGGVVETYRPDLDKNFDDIFREELEAYKAKMESAGFKLDEKGAIHGTLVFMLARTLIGAAIGGAEGDTPEERIRNAAIGGGIGFISPYALRVASKAFESIARAGSPTIRKVMRELEATGHDQPLLQIFDPKGMKVPAVPSPAPAMASAVAPGLNNPPTGAQNGPITNGPAQGNVIPPPPVDPQPKPKFVVKTNLTPEQIADFKTADPSTIDIGDKQMKINWRELGDQQDIEDVLTKLTSINAQNIDRVRKSSSLAAIQELARKSGLSLDSLMSRQGGAALDAVQTQSLIDFLGGALRETVRIQNDLAINPGDPSLEEDFIHQLNVVKGIHESAMGARFTAGQTLNVWRTTANGYVDVASRLMDNVNTLRPENTTVNQPTQQISPTRLAISLKETFGNDMKKVSKFVDQATRPGAGDMILETLYGGFWLSNPQTLGVNALANQLLQVFAVPERMIAAGIGTASRGLEAAGIKSPSPDHVYWSEVPALAFGIANSVPRAMEIAAHAFKTGERSSASAKMELVPEKAISSENLSVGPFAPLIDFLGAAIRTAPRALMATDEYYKVTNAFGQIYTNALRSGLAQGLEGDPFAKSVISRLKDLPPEDIKQAREYGDYMTLNSKMGHAGQFGLLMMNSLPKHFQIPLKFVVPFISISVNAFKRAAERTPLALVMPSFWDDINAGGARAETALGRLAFGGAMLLGFGMLQLQGKMTGHGETDPSKKNLQKSSNWQACSLVFSDGTQYRLDRLDPYGGIACLGADWAKYLFGHPDAEMSTRLFYMGAGAIAQNLTSKTYLPNLAEFFDAASHGDKAAVESFFKKVTGSLAPGIARGINRTGLFNDKYLRSTRTAWDNVIGQLPGLSDSVPPDRDIYGYPVYIPGGLGPDIISGVAVSQRKNEPHYKALVDAGIGLRPLGDSIAGSPTDPMSLDEGSPDAGIRLTPQQADRYRVLAGHEVKANGKTFEDSVKDLVSSRRWEGMTDYGRGVMVSALHSNYAKLARVQLMKEYPELKEALIQRSKNMGNALRGSNR